MTSQIKYFSVSEGHAGSKKAQKERAMLHILGLRSCYTLNGIDKNLCNIISWAKVQLHLKSN